MRELTGGCLCGQVRYSANADPAFVGVCHCKHCQKQTGTAFSVIVGIPKSALSVQGQLKAFHDTGESGQAVDRNFCPECGSPIFTRCRSSAEHRVHQGWNVRRHGLAGSQRHIYCDSKEQWTLMPEGSQVFARGLSYVWSLNRLFRSGGRQLVGGLEPMLPRVSMQL